MRDIPILLERKHRLIPIKYYNLYAIISSPDQSNNPHMPDLASLIALCTDNRSPSDRADFRSSKVYAVLEDAFTLWCSLHAPREAAAQENSPYETEKARREREIRLRWADKNFPGFVAVENARGPEALALTLKYMAEGRCAILYPALWFLPKHMFGKANMIVRSDAAPSVFGDYHYTLVQLKQAIEAKHHYCIQGALLNRILGLMQGYQAPEFRLFLRTKDVTLRQHELERELDEVLDTWNAIKDGLLEPEPCKPPNAASAPWRAYANELVIKKKDIILLAGISREWRQKLRMSGIHTTDDAALAGLARLQELTDEQAAPEIYGNALAYRLNTPIGRDGARFALPQKSRNLYFDFENADSMQPGQPSYVYLIGVWDAETGTYSALLAKNAAEEEGIFRQFAELVGDPSQALLYHWTEHETHHIKEAAAKYPVLAKAMQALLPACCDLKKVVQKAFYLPAPSLSLKAAAPALGFSWRQLECGAMDSMAHYWDWVENNNQEAIKKVLIYNEDDCLAMHRVHKALSAREPLSLERARELIESGATEAL